MKKTIITSILAAALINVGLGCQDVESVDVLGTQAQPETHTLRGGVSLTLKPDTSFDDDELASRNHYGATLTDASGRGWFTRVASVDEASLLDRGLSRADAVGRELILGATSGEEGSECLIFASLGDGRFLALSRVDEVKSCPTAGASALAWLPDAELIATDASRPGAGLGEAQQALSFGSYVGSFNGVDAYSNGSTGFDSQIHSCCGLEWQCVEYVNRYYVQALGHQNLIQTGHAKDYFNSASSKGLVAFENGGSTSPAVNDMLVSEGSPGYDSANYGHIAIVREVGPDYVTVIQQNWSEDSRDNAKKLSMSVSNGQYTVGGFSNAYPVRGWLRQPGSPNTDPNPSPTGDAVVFGVTPTYAWLGNPMTFIISGQNLPPTLAFWIGDCANLYENYVTSTEASFTCTPSYTSGLKDGVVKTQSGGTELLNFTVWVQ